MYLMGKSFGGAVATYLSLLTARDSTPAEEIFSGLCLESTFTTVADVVKFKTRGYLPHTFYCDLGWPTIDKISIVKIAKIQLIHGDADTLIPLAMAYHLK